MLIPLAAAAPSFAATTAPHDETIQIEADSALLDGNGHQEYVTTQPDPAAVYCYTTDPNRGYGTWYFLDWVLNDPSFPHNMVAGVWTAAENFQTQPQVPHC